MLCGAMRQSLRFNRAYEVTAEMTAASVHTLPITVRNQAWSVFV